jgi:hypothetical protein
MTEKPPPTEASPNRPATLGEMPPDELRRYASQLGIDLDPTAPVEEVARRVRERQELLIELDRDAMLDVIIWERRPVRKSASKEELAKEIARIQQTNYDSLSTRGLVVLARLRGLNAALSDNAHDIIDRLRKNDGFWTTLRRRRRAVVGSLLTKLFERPQVEGGEYHFLPDDDALGAADRRSLKQEVVERGLVGGIAQKLRGAADDYIKVKLDEIETRIDAKLDEIDKRLGQWRDREVANRLKILRITLIFTVLVAVLSLGYNLVKSRMVEKRSPEFPAVQTQIVAPDSNR